MSKFAHLAGGLTAALLATCALAADPPHSGGHVAGAPHGGMPPRGFHAAPPSFHGQLPQGSWRAGSPRYEQGRPGHDLSVFNGRRYSGFTAADRSQWQTGAWRHEYHNGHMGWWWVVGSFWFFYPAPIYPYPTYVGPDYYYDYYGLYPQPAYYWYYCEDPPGYYPAVQACNVEWEPVPPQGP